MPVILVETVSESATMSVWHLTESTDELEKQMVWDDQTRKQYLEFKNDHRKRQWLGSRLLVQKLFYPNSVQLSYNENGKPIIEDFGGCISISHSGAHVAVIKDVTHPVGIDIEMIRPKVERVMERFLQEDELTMIGEPNKIEKLIVCWGAKESLYKTYGFPEVDFRSDIRLNHFDYLCNGTGLIRATFNLPDKIIPFNVFYRRLEDCMLVWALK